MPKTTTPDFKIKPGCKVFLHHQSYGPGQEAALQAEGFTSAQKKSQVQRGAITWTPPKRKTKATAKPKVEPDTTT